MSRKNIEDMYVLSPIQQGMLFHALYAEEAAPGAQGARTSDATPSGSYVVQMAWTLQGPLDAEALRRAWQVVVDRHSILRTSFVWERVDKPRQVVWKRVPIGFEQVDLRGAAAEEQEREIERLTERDRRGFDLRKAPLMRFLLVARRDDVHRFVWTSHHAISDGWSLPIVLREVFALYDAFAQGRELPLERARPYADFIDWLQKQDPSRAEAFWGGYLAGFSSPTPLGVDHPATGGEPRFASRAMVVSEADAGAIEAFARRNQLTISTLLHGAFALLLARYSGEEEVLFGTTVSGRSAPLPGIERLVGPLLNTLPVRIRVPAEQGTLEWLQALQGQLATLREYEHSPLYEVQRHSAVPGGTPLFESIFVFENYPVDESLREGTSSFTVVDPKTIDWTNYPLTVQASFRHTLALRVSYSLQRFDDATAERLIGHLRALLDGVVARPGAPIGELPILGEAERRRLLVEWNATAAPYPRDACLHHLIEAQVTRSPDKTAVVFEGQALSYRELGARSDRLARHLGALGVGRDTLVGLCVERSLEMVVALLGILKAGGAYVPLDPAYPRDRLAFILADARAPVLVTQRALVDHAPALGAEIVLLDGAELAEPESAAPRAEATSDALAYVIYTSGSTGRPKGVEIQHRAVVNFMGSMAREPGMSAGDTLLAVTSLSFDIAGLELFLPLTVGATVEIVSHDVAADGPRLLDRLQGSGATVMQATPATWHLLLEAGWQGTPGLRILCGGEALPRPLADQLLDKGASLWNMFGPTETTIWSSVQLLTAAESGPVPIGRPIANTQMYVVDARLSLVPIRVPGELHIGGDGLARGYHGRPDLTEEKFIADRFRDEPGARLYRTGDLARVRADGVIEFLGRIDHQVKIRGFRIELGEIETVLGQHGLVREAVVVAREDDPGGFGEKRLVAYVVPRVGGADEEGSAGGDAGDRVTQWGAIWDETYKDTQADDATFNIAGWRSSYTGEPIPAEEMREWVDHTVGRILALGASRVMEIGCGTGLLRFRVAPHASRYFGTDISAAALRSQQRAAGGDDGRVTLAERTAEDWSGVEPRSFDAIIVNSVVQYFPNVDYLLRVLDGAVEAVADGGHIFLGDVRSLPLLEAMHTATELYRAPDTLPVAELRQRVARRVAEEEELLLHPELFAALQRRLPRIGRVEVQLKRGRYHNELTRFRYDVILHLGPAAAQAALLSALDWQEQGLTLAGLRGLLTGTRPRALRLTRVPNARLQAEVATVSWLAGGSAPETAGELRARLASLSTEAAVEPEDLWALGVELGYSLDIVWSGSGADGCFEIVCRRQAEPADAEPAATSLVEERAAARPWSHYANNPLRKTVDRELVPKLRAHLKERLPDYMLPAAFVVLDALPRTPNGKIDRRALPAPEASAATGEVGAARSPIEEVLAGTWAQVLKLESVGPRDSFFELGGHSLLATQALARIRATFGVDLPLRAMFEAPTPAALASRVEQALRARAGVEEPPLVRAPREGAMALSFAQERLWFLQQLDPDDVSYLMPVAIRLEGALDRDALARTLDEVVRRHEVLRTRCALVNGSPAALVDEGFRLEVPVVALTGLPEAEREPALRQAIAEETRRPLDLGAAPPIRARLFVLGAAEHVLLVVIHHIATDAWSMGVLGREVGALYEAFAAGRPSPLPELPVQYADYGAWQRQWLSREILERQLAWWKAHLSGAPETIALPLDRARPAVRTSRGGQVSVELSRELAQGLRKLARREGATLYMVLLAALDVLLYRMSGQADLVVGSPIAGRTRAETEGMVGLFLNMLALRARVEDAEPFTALLTRVKETCLGAYAHQDLPFERLVQELAVERDPSRTPVFQVVLNLQNAPGGAARLPGLHMRSAGVELATTKFDLTFILAEVPQGLAGTLSYRTDLFDATTVERMVGHLRTLLEGIVADPSQPVGELPLLRAEERQRLLTAFHPERAGHDAGARVHALFEAQVERTPEALAVVAGAERLTFAALDRRANQLAHRLRGMGVGPDTVVGLCLDRTADVVVGLLGILKAGGAYLPLDPTLPRPRLRELLEEARVPGVVTAERVADALPEHASWRVRLDADAASLAAESDARPGPAARPGNLAYVLFTSGSTGRPKGVAVEHGNLVAYVHGASERLAVPSGASYAHVSTLAADLGNTSLFLPLCQGGTLHLISEELTRDPAGLGAYFDEHAIDCMKIAPSHLAALLSAPRPSQVVPRQALVLGGEALSWELVDRIAKLAPGCRVFNHYGPTETCVGVLAGAASEAQRDATIVPLGRPLDAARIYVLDAQLEPVPVGVPGEVYVGGAQVARGYLGRPDQTAERFVPDPFDAAGARLYRAGDRARWLVDGTLLFLGRVDHQVKVRGYRVELGEIEAVLEQHPAVRDAVVLALDDVTAGKRLAAFVVIEPRDASAEPVSFFAATEPRAVSAELVAFLASRLPSYMVPGALTVLEALPLTPNGKVDRRALEELEQHEDHEPRELLVPRTPTEEVLEAIWADVFGREHVGVEERFDELGGHSLLAIQLIARVREAFQLEVPLRAIFEAPTIAALADRIEALQREGGVATMPPIERASRDQPLPLSFAQERLWFLDRLDPGSAFYNVPSGQRLQGALDAAVLERALREVVRRHEVLRTTFALADGQPVQVIHDEVALRLPVEDLSALPEAEREARVAEIASAEARLPFDLEQGPVLRVRLLRLGPEEHVLVAVLHHIVSDAWTQRVLYDEAAKLYAAFLAGQPSPLPALPVQYADYAAWQRRWLSGDVLEQQLAWWKAHLLGAPAALEVPTDRPRPAVMSHRGRVQSFGLPPELGRALGALARREGATLFMVLLAAFDVLLSRYTGQRDVVVGMPIAGRSRVETERLIGFFVNTLALRVELDEDQSFQELVARVREVCLSAYAHQDLPFERLVEELHPTRDLARTPLFQVMLVMQNARPESRPTAGLARRGVTAESGTAKFDLTFFFGEGPDGLGAMIEYAADLFEASTIERMGAQLQTLLEGIVAAPEAPIAALPLLPEPEQHRLLVAWNATEAPYPADATLADLVEAQVARTPTSPAVAYLEQTLSYRELDERANRLASKLQSLGVGPDVPVGVCLPRSLELAVAVLGILKAGGAYLPLDPEYPADRLAYMVGDTLGGASARRPVLIVDERCLSALPASAVRGAETLYLDREWSALAAGPAPRADRAGLSPEHLSYVVYTSGSTGRPKGVGMPHRPLVNLVAYMLSVSGDALRTVQLTSPNFDVFIQELFTTWCAGGLLVLVPDEVRRDMHRLRSAFVDAQIERAFMPPATLYQLAETEGAAPLPASLRELYLAGEQLQITGRVVRLLEGLPALALHNHCGPAETHVVTEHVLTGPPEGWPTLPSIGRPIGNARIYVLDRAMRPVPTGVAGELYIGGILVARGYLGRPDQTAERFVPDPYGDGGRLYRTGDLVRYRADGALDFLGRIDLQVKVRGYRVEVGEIESVLVAHPGVRDAAVVAREYGPGDKRLAAYVVPSDGAAAPSAAVLRAFLKDRLPEYMVPSAFVVLDALPLTPNNKVDRKALPAPEVSASQEHVAPRGPVEEAVCGIFAEVLKLATSRVGARDGFFELGGHSLLATQAISRIRATFGVELPVRALFEAPTPAELGMRVEAALRAGAGVAAPPLARASREGPMALSFAQERLWFLQQLEPDDISYLVPVAIRLEGALDRDALARALDEVVRRQEVLRTRCALVDGTPAAIVDEGFRLDLATVDLASHPEAERELALRAAIAAEMRPFDLGAAPPIRARLFVLGEAAHVLLVVMHHIATDGWSMGVLQSEIGALYEAFHAGQPSPLPELPIQYADYAAWQRAWLSGEVLERQLAYWKAHLSGAPAALELPTDRPRPPLMSHRGGRRTFVLPPELGVAVAALARREGATLFMVLLAAYEVLLYRYSGQRDIVVGTPIAGRTRAETESLIGFFINTLALHAELDDELSFRELLGRVRETCLGAYAHQDLPFERLVEELNPVRDPSRTPLFQHLFSLQVASAQEAEPVESGALAGLRRRSVGTESTTSQFDLNLTCVESGGRLMGGISYLSDLYDASTVDRLMGHFRVVLEGIVACPGARLAELPVAGEDERRQVLVTWNDTRAPLATHACAHALFEAQAARTPDAVAVVAADGELSYRELNERANQLAHHLRTLGVGPEVLVGLCVERSAALVVSVLGVLKAGGAYLPLDPTYPVERLGYMLEDSGVFVIVTVERIADTLPTRALMVLLDAEQETLAAERVDDPTPLVGPSNLAYVIYTSGSTGRPKGVLIEHGGLSAYLSWVVTDFEPAGGSGVPVHSSAAFDLTVTGLFAPLIVGKSVVMLPEADEIEALVGTLVDPGGYSFLKLTPAHLELLNRLVPADRAEGATRVLIVGGDVVTWEMLAFWRTNAPGTRLINEYGPTETVVGCTFHDAVWDGVSSGAVSIGRPSSNTRMYVLDRNGEPTPLGVPGELYIGGAQMARGYLGRPEQTAERFVPDPFGGEEGARLYRTGDRVRWSPRGELDFFGRLDEQVKIRGYRIELDEIKANLLSHSQVLEAAVVAREDTPGDKRLVAYYVAAERDASLGADLRAHLASLLPEYMVPSAFVALEALPLTANGKLDRKALPPPGAAPPEQAESVAPRGPVEEAVAEIFAEVLGVPATRIGAHDGFFELGGHSLLATQAMSRIVTVFGVELALRVLFEAPTPAELAARIEDALRAGAGVDLPPIVRAPRAGTLALSFAQERMWVLHEIDPDDPSYVVALAVRLEGVLDAGALARALDEVVRRHEVLRTRFVTVDGHAEAVADEGFHLELVRAPLTARPEAERAAAAREAIAAAVRRPFDLGAAPPLRATLFVLGDEDHVLLLVMHHIITDGWSTGVLSREFDVLYEAFSAGRPSPLPELAVQYADYAAWQRQWLSGEVLGRQLAWWKAHLSGAPAALELPTDRPRGAARSHRGGVQRVELGEELSGALSALARGENATVFMVLLAAYATLLSRWSGQRDVVVGSPIAGRTHGQTEGLIGFFVNTLAMRVELDDERSFVELLARVREACLGAYAHQDLPFERLVEELNPTRDLSRAPLFQAMLTLQNAPRGDTPLAGQRRTGMDVGSGTAKFDLTLTLSETARGLVGALEYAADLFDAATVERMSEHLGVLLAAVVAQPTEPLWRLALLPERERERLLVAWNETAPAFSAEVCVHLLFEEQVDRTPEATALIAGTARLSYRELDQRANRLAHHLRRKGVGRDVLVGLCVTRSVDLVVGMLGILKAGGAYVPVDPSYPPHRMAQYLEDARAPVLVTQERLRAGLPETGALQVLLDADADAIARESEARPEGGAGPRDLAYVLYTSGSTGRPKGVAIEHHSTACLLRWAHQVFTPAELSRVMFSTSICFDLSVFELFVPLAMGGGVVLAENALELPDLPAREEITLINTVPSAMAELVRAGSVPRSVTTVCLAGEALRVSLAEQVYALSHVTRLFNLYGPTEDTTYSTWSLVPRVGAPDIGRPIAGGLAYILDAHLTPVPLGARGELYLGGEGLARGYHGRADLTAERFVENPFDHRYGGRMYRTGDLARYLPDGAIEYLGRADHMVKVRGFRIELGEIEAVLLGLPGVHHAVVAARDDGPGAPGSLRLVAYVVPADVGAPPAALRELLKDRLPEYMVPSAFVVLPALPLTPNGKVDRQALPAPEAQGQEEHVAPRGLVEEALCKIFGEVLRLKRTVGVHDNFFEIGGDSILGIQIVARARAAGIALAPRQLFEHQTIAELAAAAGVAGVAREDRGAVTGPVTFTPIQRWWLEDDPIEPHHFNQSLLLEASERLDPAVLEAAVRVVMEHHDAFRLRVTRGAGGLEQRLVALGEAVPFRAVDLGQVPEGGRRAALEAQAAEVQASLDLAGGPVFRVVLFGLGAGERQRLLVVGHHFAVDGVSWRILLEDIWGAYQALRRGEPARLPERTTSLQRWSARLSEHARSEALGAERGYWLAEARRAARPLPIDRPEGDNTEASIRNAVVSLSPEETEALLREVPDAYRTQINDVLLAALAEALGAWSRSPAVLVDLEGHGREDLFEDVDLTRTVGWFTTLFPVLLELPPDGGPGARLIGVKEQLRAVPNRGIGYGLLRYLRGDEELSAALRALPQAEVTFNYLGQLDQALPEAAPLGGAAEAAGPSRSPRARRRHLLDVAASIAGGRLRTRFSYSEALHDAATVQALASGFIEALRAIIAHCRDPHAGGPTPSDFQRPGLTQDVIDRVAALGPSLSDDEPAPIARPYRRGT